MNVQAIPEARVLAPAVDHLAAFTTVEDAITRWIGTRPVPDSDRERLELVEGCLREVGGEPASPVMDAHRARLEQARRVLQAR